MPSAARSVGVSPISPGFVKVHSSLPPVNAYASSGARVLKEMMWAVLGHLSQVVCNGLERLMLAALCDHVELASMGAVHVDLLVVE